MTQYDQPVRAFMTETVHVIDMESPLPLARKMMEDHRIRHLPVVDGSRIVGLLSERDLSKLEGFPMVNLDMVSVPDAMSSSPYMVAPNTPVVEVLRKMREDRLGSAIVVEDEKVVGIFTSVDALSILINVLTR
jgi:acetoin utilization protein AcuB